MQRTFLFFLFLSISLFACQKEALDASLFDLKEGEVVMLFRETQCADPWYDAMDYNPEIQDSYKINSLLTFMEKQGIEILAISYEFNEDEAMACLACTCLTGGRYYIKIVDNKWTIQELTDFGFVFE